MDGSFLYLIVQIRAFLQLGTNAGKHSIGIAMDVATKLMVAHNITPKFTLSDLRDAITKDQCGLRSQSRRFYQLDNNFQWGGKVVSLKVPVVQLQAFPPTNRINLAKSKCKTSAED